MKGFANRLEYVIFIAKKITNIYYITEKKEKKKKCNKRDEKRKEWN